MHGVWHGLAPDKLERRGTLDGYGDLPVLNNYRNVLSSVLARHGANPANLAVTFPGFTLDPLNLFA